MQVGEVLDREAARSVVRGGPWREALACQTISQRDADLLVQAQLESHGFLQDGLKTPTIKTPSPGGRLTGQGRPGTTAFEPGVLCPRRGPTASRPCSPGPERTAQRWSHRRPR